MNLTVEIRDFVKGKGKVTFAELADNFPEFGMKGIGLWKDETESIMIWQATHAGADAIEENLASRSLQIVPCSGDDYKPGDLIINLPVATAKNRHSATKQSPLWLPCFIQSATNN